MCMDVRVRCKCGKYFVPFNLRDNIMPEEVVEAIYCPEESKSIKFDNKSMINDNGWIIEYNMELAKFIAARKLDLSPDIVTPEFLFDEGYATWKEVFPGEQELSKKDREKIMKLAKSDPKKYFTEFRNWANKRMTEFKDAGWRKAQKIA